ncbi:MAG: hypothetical protein JWO97_2530, partial [Acidobacteria bacterium]|nr:hypothetical protein [Acidobacteriota bacterium]
MLRKIALLSCAFAFIALASPASTNQDDSCDIAVTPAATLLLPYFEVDLSSAADVARTTLFSVINTSPQPQIARVTLWSDWAFPAYSFDLFLTGYDVQSVNLRDVLVSGAIPQTPTGAIAGSLSQSNHGNPNHLPSMVSDCAKRPQAVPAYTLGELRQILTTGIVSSNSCSMRVGGKHANAIGYATIDVVATCSTSNPSSPSYLGTELLFDNVLTGDYQYLNPSSTIGNDAGGSPLVHIRAIPEGGPAGSNVATNLPFTFYDRLTVANATSKRSIDRRQPLPTAFAAHYLQSWLSDASTRLYIWRESSGGPNPTCDSYARNSDDIFTEIVRFDEH